MSALSVDESHAVFHTSTNLKIASSYLELKDYSNAKRHCDAVLSQDDKNVDALIKRTEAEIGAEDYDSARRTAARCDTPELWHRRCGVANVQPSLDHATVLLWKGVHAKSNDLL